MNTSKIKDLLNQKRDECLAENVIHFESNGILIESEVTSKDGKYTFNSFPIGHVNGAQDIIHVVAHKSKLDALKLKHPHMIDGEYGEQKRVIVKNNETGNTSHHLVYQSGYSYSSKKPLMGVRSYGQPKEYSQEHADALAAHIGKKHVPSWKKITK